MWEKITLSPFRIAYIIINVIYCQTAPNSAAVASLKTYFQLKTYLRTTYTVFLTLHTYTIILSVSSLVLFQHSVPTARSRHTSYWYP